MKNKWEVTHDEYSFDTDRWPSLESRLCRIVAEDPVCLSEPQRSRRIDARLAANSSTYRTNKLSQLMVKQQNDRKVLLDLNDIEATRIFECIRLNNSSYHNEIKRSAWHYGVLQDLGEEFSLEGVLSVSFGNDINMYYGNFLTPGQMSSRPDFSIDGVPSGRYSLMLIAMDGNLVDADRELVLWMATNAHVKGNQIQYRDEPVPFLRPFPIRGLGSQRFAALLIRQLPNQKLQFDYDPTSRGLDEIKARTLKVSEFVKTNKLKIIGICFIQSRWEANVTTTFHQRIGISEPVFEYKLENDKLPEQVIHPELLPFNRYLDAYRDRKDVNEQVLKQYLEDVCPFEGHIHDNLPYPHAEPYEEWMPTWYRKEVDAYRSRVRKYAWIPRKEKHKERTVNV
ncbi:hypothetical protein ACOME3_006704 [Neoechinorhynchus agilis]